MLFREVADYALNEDTDRLMAEQIRWIEAEPTNAQPYYHLAMFYRLKGRQDEALALLLETVHLDCAHAAAHLALTEIYAVRADYPSARRHAKAAARSGRPEGAALLERYGVADPEAGRGPDC